MFHPPSPSPIVTKSEHPPHHYETVTFPIFPINVSQTLNTKRRTTVEHGNNHKKNHLDSNPTFFIMTVI